MGIEDIIKAKFSVGANIVPTDRKGIAKIGNPNITRIFESAGRNCEVFTATSVRTGILSGETKADVLADAVMPYIPKFYSKSIGHEDVRYKASDLAHDFIVSCLEGYTGKEPVVIINNKSKSGEVSSTVLIAGDTTISVARNRQKTVNYEETKNVLESVNLLSMNTAVFAESQEDSTMLKALRSTIANSEEKSGPICQALSCKIGSNRGIQRTPLAVQASSLEYKIDRHGEVFISKSGTEFNVSQESGKIIQGTENAIAVTPETISPQLITTLEGENVIKTGCAVQIGRDGSNYLSGRDDILASAIETFECEARFIEPKPLEAANPAPDPASEQDAAQ